jgi:hypothetical protein
VYIATTHLDHRLDGDALGDDQLQDTVAEELSGSGDRDGAEAGDLAELVFIGSTTP